jgi:cytochrome b
MLKSVRVWDLPTRVFHWALVTCVVCLFVTSQIGGDAMDWHFRFGYAVLSLLMFRIIWGLVGGRWSRFASFIYSPSTVLRYAKGQGLPEHSVGHNPLGAGSVFAMLLFLLVQVGTGLISDDEIAASGPLTRFVSAAVTSHATTYHKDWGKVILLILIALHIGAILFYLLKKKENLVRSMLLGDKLLTMQTLESSRDDAASRVWAAVLLAACAAAVTGMVRLAG